MKMNDKFDLPLRFNSTPFLKDDSGERPIYFQFVFNDLDDGSRIARAKFACHAINNHDRLTEENAKLRQMLKYAVNVANDQNATYTAIEVMNIEVQQLLNQLKDQSK